MKDITKELRAVERKIVKIKKSVKRSDLDYVIQFSMNSTNPGQVKYAVQITPFTTAHGPVTFIKDSLEDVHAALDSLLEKQSSPRQIEIEYHKAEMANNSKSSERHEQEIARLEKMSDEEYENGEEVDSASEE